MVSPVVHWINERHIKLNEFDLLYCYTCTGSVCRRHHSAAKIMVYITVLMSDTDPVLNNIHSLHFSDLDHNSSHYLHELSHRIELADLPISVSQKYVCHLKLSRPLLWKSVDTTGWLGCSTGVSQVWEWEEAISYVDFFLATCQYPGGHVNSRWCRNYNLAYLFVDSRRVRGCARGLSRVVS